MYCELDPRGLEVPTRATRAENRSLTSVYSGYLLLGLSVVLGECEVVHYVYLERISVAYGIFFNIGAYILFALAICSVNLRLNKAAAPSATAAPVVNAVYTPVFSMLALFTVSIIGVDSVRRVRFSSRFSRLRTNLARIDYDMQVAYEAACLLAVSGCGLHLVLILMKLRAKRVAMGVSLVDAKRGMLNLNVDREYTSWHPCSTSARFFGACSPWFWPCWSWFRAVFSCTRVARRSSG